MKLDSIYVVVRDMAAAREYYQELFQRKPLLVQERFSGFDLDGGLFGLLNAAAFGEAVDESELVYGNNCVPTIRVADLDSVHERLSSGEAAVTDIQETGDYRLFQISDPDGNRIEFYEQSE